MPQSGRRGTNLAVSKRTRFALQVQKPTEEAEDAITAESNKGITSASVLSTLSTFLSLQMMSVVRQVRHAPLLAALVKLGGLAVPALLGAEAGAEAGASRNSDLGGKRPAARRRRSHSSRSTTNSR